MDDVSATCTVCFEQGHLARDCTEVRSDFKLIGPLAAFIAARLQYDLPPCNSSRGGGRPVSTIRVDQHKEKFWYVRIYCKLADDNLVLEKWLSEGRDALGPTPEFKAQCFRHDAQHYRKCYLEMISLVPRLKRRIRSQADYSELLLDDDAELDAMFAKVSATSDDPLVFYRRKYGSGSDEELKQLLRSFYPLPAYPSD